MSEDHRLLHVALVTTLAEPLRTPDGEMRVPRPRIDPIRSIRVFTVLVVGLSHVLRHCSLHAIHAGGESPFSVREACTARTSMSARY